LETTQEFLVASHEALVKAEDQRSSIESLAVGHAEQPGVSRLTMVVAGGDQVIEQMTKQLLKLINVLRVQNLSHIPAVERELMLLKVSANQETRARVLELVQVFRAKVVDVADHALTLEVVGDPGKLMALEQVLKPFGILQIVRTGKVALERSSGINTEFLKVSELQSRVPT